MERMVLELLCVFFYASWIKKWEENGFLSQDHAIEVVGKSISSAREQQRKWWELEKKLESLQQKLSNVQHISSSLKKI